MRLPLLAVSFLTLAACIADVGEGKTKAKVEAVSAEQAAKVEKAAVTITEDPQLETLKLDTAGSSIRATGAKVTAEHPIDFSDFSGKVSLDSNGALTAVAYEVTMATLQADQPKLTTHLLNEDFFNVEAFPSSTFTSTAITAGSDVEGATHTVEGLFTIHGVKKKLTFPATVTVTDTDVQATTEFVINRQDFGIAYPGRPDDLIQDNVRMNIALKALRKQG